jgi:DNA-binding transcriptional ArsR family regulator
LNESWDILKALSDPTRLRLLALLSREELSVAELQEILGMGQSRISSQLALLRTVNLVSDRREGKNAFYSLRARQPARTQALTRAISRSWRRTGRISTASSRSVAARRSSISTSSRGVWAGTIVRGDHGRRSATWRCGWPRRSISPT